MATGTVDYIIIAVYMAVVVGIGFLFTTKNETTENYLLGGRNMPVFAIGLSCMMSLLSSISIVRSPGEIFNNGFTYSMFGVLTLLLQIPAYMLFTRFYFKLGSFTPYEYLEYRYNTGIRTLISISAFYSRVLYIGMVLYTTSKIFEGAYGWEPWFTICFVGVIGVFYTVMGGMKAVVWTDVIQFFVLSIGLVVTLIVLCSNIDGGAIGAVVYSFKNGHGIPQLDDPEFYKITPYMRLLFFLMLWHALVGPLGGACSDQINIQRLLATKNWQAGFRAQVISTLLGITSSVILWFIGFAIYSYYTQHPDPVVTHSGGDIAFFRFVATKLPTPMPGLFMAAMLAAIMSTLDSGINSMATVWLKEFHSKFIHKNMTTAQEVTVSRLATFWIGAFSILLGIGIQFSGKWLSQTASEVGTIFGILGAATVPAFLLAVLTKRANAPLIWGYTFFSFGNTIGGSSWFVLSRTAEQAWLKNPVLPFGWADKLSAVYLIVPLVCGLAMAAPWLVRAFRKTAGARALALLGLVWFGFLLITAQWYYFSNLYIRDVPLARSFAFSLPISFIGVFLVVWLCPVQPEKKWRGLTLATINDKIAER